MPRKISEKKEEKEEEQIDRSIEIELDHILDIRFTARGEGGGEALTKSQEDWERIRDGYFSYLRKIHSSPKKL